MLQLTTTAVLLALRLAEPALRFPELALQPAGLAVRFPALALTSSFPFLEAENSTVCLSQACACSQ